MKVVVETPRLIIRQYTEADLPDRQLIGADEVITRFTPKRSPEEIEVLFRQNLKFYQNGEGLGRWAIISKANGEYAGDCMLMTARPGLTGTELGYMLHQKFWGNGLATELAIALVQHALDTLNHQNVYAITNLENHASQQVLLKAGFSESGTIELNGMPLLLFEVFK